ncbi:hypothetical protein EI290_18015 [Hymenobacter metallilatus]|uniref:Helicase C-terminal domain-containing protein n=2 Tax=Hymenobacter metallilatus TaxID=2493666 RepID=A0A3R9N4E1_9BACT|nr:hypothetical protein EI290_18015 [Hymenobacter metallilatus]
MCGPFGGDNETLAEPPQRFYVTGVLYPEQFRPRESVLPSEAVVDEEEGLQAPEEAQADTGATATQPAGTGLRYADATVDEGEADRELNLSTDFKPASFGLSVITESRETAFSIRISYGRYNRVTPGKDMPASSPEEPAPTVDNASPGAASLGGAATAAPGAAGNGRNPSLYRRTPVVREFTLTATAAGFTLTDKEGKPVETPETPGAASHTFSLEDSRLTLRITRRSTHGSHGSIFTLSLINSCRSEINGREAEKQFISDCRNYFFQPEIEVHSDEFVFTPGPEDSLSPDGQSEEDAVRKLLFRNYRNYGAGHGAAAWWDEKDVNLAEGRARRVKAVVIPQYDVKPVDFNLSTKHDPADIILTPADQTILAMKRLAGMTGENAGELETRLRAFAGRYGDWIGQHQKRIAALPAEHHDAAQSNLQKCADLLARMERGIVLLFEQGPDTASNIALQAFQDANRAMFMQRVMKGFADKRVKKDVLPGADDQPIPDFSTAPEEAGRWRPFQLAFLLAQVEGILDPSSEDRETVDLIWFSTGGGKTEAYLGLTAFTIFYRRLRAGRDMQDPDRGAGVSVLMRYTLRLLNIQQFNRAGILICACELMRREMPDRYGKQEISTGIWVGSSLTPNKTGTASDDRSAAGAIAKYNAWLDSGTEKPALSPPISHCPCCGTRIIPDRRNNAVVGSWGYFQKQQLRRGGGAPPGGRRVPVADSPVFLSCRNTECRFFISPDDYLDAELVESRKLPVYYVDEVIYARRPSLLFATVDKFAQLAWKSETARLFNLSWGPDGRITRDFSSPDLVIQDELHLISSALGTMYGVYEFAIDELCQWGGSARPKVVGASATVRNAEAQCRRLYGRKHFAQFPPQGIDVDDSFFSRLDRSAPGRRYLGVMPAGRTATINIIYLTGRAMQLLPRLPYGNATLDWYYTMLVYFNSIKELGKFRTLLTDDIAAHRYGMNATFQTLGAPGLYIPFKDDRVAELSSAMTADQIYQYLNRLENSKLPQPAPASPTEEARLTQLRAMGVRSARDLDGNRTWRQVFTDPVLEALGIAVAGKDNTALFQALKGLLVQLFGDNREEPIHVVSATNMISVGVDIARLNIMQVVGQPKSTAEYIQASSRAGREFPGLVVASYNNAKSRDRSHYESFTDYHQAFYKHVEANSVTPYSLPALEKALPSVLIALMRLLHFREDGNAWWPTGAEGRATDEFYTALVEKLKERVTLLDEDVSDFLVNIDQVAQQLKKVWNGRSDATPPGPGLRFAKNSHFFPSPKDVEIDLDLFVNHEYDEQKRRERPAVLGSLRNVESSSALIITY